MQLKEKCGRMHLSFEAEMWRKGEMWKNAFKFEAEMWVLLETS